MSGGSKAPKTEHVPDQAQIGHGQTAPGVVTSYSGTVLLDSDGEAWVSLPAGFETQNRNFSYQLTAIGAPAPNLYIAQKISANRFKIAGGNPSMEVSWQVISVRQDVRVVDRNSAVEVEKRPPEKASLKRSVAPNPAPPTITRATAPAALTVEDISSIKDILERQFKRAFESRSMSEMQKVWPDMPRVARNDIAKLFRSSEVQDFRMDLNCLPTVAANEVLARCSHTFRFSLDRKAQAPLQFSVVYRLKRAGGEWHLEESRPGLATAPLVPPN